MEAKITKYNAKYLKYFLMSDLANLKEILFFTNTSTINWEDVIP